MGLVPGVILGIYGAVQTVTGSDRSTLFWLFAGALSLAGVLALVAYRALQERDTAKAQQENRQAGVTIGQVSVHLDAPAAPAAPATTPSVASEPTLGEPPAPGSVIQGEVVRLTDSVGAYRPMIERVTFQECELRGPALLAPLREFTAVDCEIWARGANAIWVLDPKRQPTLGVIAVVSCTFIRCQFRNVGVAVLPEAVERFKFWTGEDEI